MKYNFLLVFVAIIATAFAALTDEQKEHIKSEAKKCIESSGVDKEILKKARAGNIQDDEKFKEFILCAFVKVNLINEAGEVVISTEKAKQWLPESFSDEEKDNIITTCNQKKGSTPKDTAFLLYKCYRANYPPEYKPLF